jgi:hypothetical protein
VIDIIIDLETLGTRPGCVILEIGACAINPKTGEIVSNFSRRLDEFKWREDEPVDGDMHATINWWHNPETVDVYHALIRRRFDGVFGKARNPAIQLREFADWYKCHIDAHGEKEVRIWANGPSFDIAILQAAYDRYGIKRPWICWQERCVRTALEQAGYEKGSTSWVERGPRHRALNDARHEARKLFYSGALGEVSAIIKRLHQGGTLKARQA